MIGLLRAFALLRWRLFVNGLRGRRRDAFEQVSRISRVLVVAIVAVTFLPGSILLGFLAFIGGRGMAQGDANLATVVVGAKAALAVVVVIVAVSPILRFGGSAASMSRLAILPISRRVLWLVELAVQVADPWILALVPGLLALPAGFAAGGSATGALVAAAASVAALGFLASLGSAASLLGALLFRNRRLGELVAIGFLLALTGIGYLPILAQKTLKLDAGRAVRDQLLESGGRQWLRVLPWEQYARAIEAAAGRPAAATLPLAALLAAGGAAALASRWAFGRLLDAPASRANRSRRTAARLVAVPGLSPAATAVAVNTLRLVLRSVRGRVMIFTAPVPALMIALIWKSTTAQMADPPPGGVIVVLLAGLLALMSMQALLADQFAVDRAGLTLTFLTPVSDLDLVIGKAAGGLAAVAIPTAIATAGAAILRPGGSPLLWLGALLAVVAIYLVQAPFAALLSALLPAPFDLMKLKGGNGHPLAMILSMLAVIAAFVLVAGAGILAYWMAGHAWGALAGAAAALLLAVGIAALMFPVAARAVTLRRENLALTAQGR